MAKFASALRPTIGALQPKLSINNRAGPTYRRAAPILTVGPCQPRLPVRANLTPVPACQYHCLNFRRTGTKPVPAHSGKRCFPPPHHPPPPNIHPPTFSTFPGVGIYSPVRGFFCASSFCSHDPIYKVNSYTHIWVNSTIQYKMILKGKLGWGSFSALY